MTDSTVVTGDGSLVVVLTPQPTAPKSDPLVRAEALRRASRERTRQRLITAGFEDDERVDRAVGILARRALPEAVARLAQGRLLALAGELGTDKSEIAEAWHRRGIDTMVEEAGPIPVWLVAKHVIGSLDDAVAKECGGESVLAERGCDLVLDELDALADMRVVRSRLDEAAVFARSRGNVRVLATVRPGYDVRENERFDVPLLKETEGLELATAVANSSDRGLEYDLPPEVLDAIQTPLFAILVGSELKDLPRPFNRPALLHRLASRTLSRLATRTGVPVATESVGSVLRRLAIASTIGPPLLAGEVEMSERLVASRVVAEGPQGQLQIMLPIVEQYFAAQALLHSEVPLNEIVANDATVTTWRYALAVALAVGTTDDAARLMTPIARCHPGISSWLVNEALMVTNGSRTAPEAKLPADPNQPQVSASQEETLAAGNAALAAITTWLDAFDKMRQQFPFVASDGQPRPLGVSLASDGSFDSTWAPSGADLPPVFCLYPPYAPAVLDNLPSLLESPEWGPLKFSRRLAAAKHWPWYWSRDQFGSELNDVLRQRRLIPRPGGMLAAERNWRLARSLLSAVHVLHPPLDPTEVIAKIEMHKGRGAAPSRIVEIPFPDGMSYSVEDLERLARHCRGLAESGQMLERPIPVPDQPSLTGRFLWSNYSPELLRDLVEIVWREALIGYTQLAVDYLPRFGRTLGLMALGRIKLDGAVVISDKPDITGAPVLEYLISALSPETDLDSYPPLQPGDPVPEPEVMIRLEYASHRQTEPYYHRGYTRTSLIPRGVVATAYGHPHAGSPALDIYDDSPATVLAHQWLNHDLARLGWVRPDHYRD